MNMTSLVTEENFFDDLLDRSGSQKTGHWSRIQCLPLMAIRTILY